MKIVNFGPKGTEQPGVLVDADTIVPLVPVLLDAGYPELSTNAILALLPHLRPEIAARVQDAADSVQVADVRLGPPVPKPPKIIVAGANYWSHAEATSGRDAPKPSDPMIVFKPTNTIIGPHDQLIRPAQSERMDYEVELVVVIGRGGYRIPRERAYQHVAGYMIGNDVTSFDIAFKDVAVNPMFMQLARGKGIRTGAPTGPWLVTADEIADPHQLDMTTWVNGELRQQGRTDDMIVDIPGLIASFTEVLTLEPGDIIYTGTVPGTGAMQKPPAFLFGGDVVRMRIEGLGEMETPIVDEKL